jgi:phosphoglycolate phosphatase
MGRYGNIIFDLDGTLFDTSRGIYNSVRYVEDKLGLEYLSQEKLKLFIGPPPFESYKKLYGMNDSLAKAAVKYHREYAAMKGIFEANVYENIVELLNILKIKSYKIAIATLKRQDLTEKILKHFKLGQYFNTIVGIDNMESLTKADIINIALKKMNVLDKATAIMIGDSEYDAIGAEQAGIDFIGVTYGFGFDDKREVDKFKNIACFCTVNEIISLLDHI